MSGVTTVRNMPGSPGLSKILKVRDKINQGEVPGPRILTSGPAISPPYGYFSIRSYFPDNALLRSILMLIFRVRDLSIDIDCAEQAKDWYAYSLCTRTRSSPTPT